MAPLLRQVGLSLRDVDNDETPLSVISQIKCLNLLADALDDRLLGFHVGKGVDLRRGGLLYYVAASSEVLSEALQRIARYSAIVNEGVKLETEVGDTLRVAFNYAGVPRRADRHQIEAWIALLTRYCRDMTDRGLLALRVRLIHNRIPESVEIDNFLGRTAEFSADIDDISFAAEAGRLPIIHADPFLNKLLIGYCENILARHRAGSGQIRADVENALTSLLPHGQTRIENVARRLGVTPRTLRRKLAAEGLTFAGILEKLRFALARRYLTERDLSISRIAWLLGYTEVSAFSHAFRRWSGRAPRAVRPQRPHRAAALSARRRAIR